MTTADPCESDDFPADQWRDIDDIIAKYRGRPGALMPVLEEVQGVTGYLPISVQRYIAMELSIPLSRVYGVVTFYSFFTMQPRGRHPIRICLGTACHVRGATRNLEGLVGLLGVKPGECTEDRRFSIEVVRCLGACGLAPVMVIDEETHRHVNPGRLPLILEPYRDNEPEELGES